MNTYALCPCCSDKLIHHINQHRNYWFCRRCWQEMPIIESKMVTQQSNQVKCYQKPQVKTFGKVMQTNQASLRIS